jgi:ferredoxin
VEVEEVDRLKAEAQRLAKQLQDIRSRIARAGSSSTRRVATIDGTRCSVCGACLSICPVDAISLEDGAWVDPAKCSACGICVERCPNDAIRLLEPHQKVGVPPLS